VARSVVALAPVVQVAPQGRPPGLPVRLLLRGCLRLRGAVTQSATVVAGAPVAPRPVVERPPPAPAIAVAIVKRPRNLLVLVLGMLLHLRWVILLLVLLVLRVALLVLLVRLALVALGAVLESTAVLDGAPVIAPSLVPGRGRPPVVPIEVVVTPLLLVLVLVVRLLLLRRRRRRRRRAARLLLPPTSAKAIRRVGLAFHGEIFLRTVYLLLVSGWRSKKENEGSGRTLFGPKFGSLAQMSSKMAP
jgi:hypothetical protein